MFLTSRQIFDCFCVSGLYDPVWDLLRDRCANDDETNWDFYEAMRGKIDDIQA